MLWACQPVWPVLVGSRESSKQPPHAATASSHLRPAAARCLTRAALIASEWKAAVLKPRLRQALLSGIYIGDINRPRKFHKNGFTLWEYRVDSEYNKIIYPLKEIRERLEVVDALFSVSQLLPCLSLAFVADEGTFVTHHPPPTFTFKMFGSCPAQCLGIVPSGKPAVAGMESWVPTSKHTLQSVELSLAPICCLLKSSGGRKG